MMTMCSTWNISRVTHARPGGAPRPCRGICDRAGVFPHRSLASLAFDPLPRLVYFDYWGANAKSFLILEVLIHDPQTAPYL
jgi:hypothetical protein